MATNASSAGAARDAFAAFAGDIGDSSNGSTALPVQLSVLETLLSQWVEMCPSDPVQLMAAATRSTKSASNMNNICRNIYSHMVHHGFQTVEARSQEQKTHRK